jgi:PKD repeat protein
VRNVGSSPAPTSTLAYYRDGLTGTLLIADSVPALEAGQAITLTTPWNTAGWAEGSYALWAAVNQGDFSETFVDNNTASFGYEVRPDLMLSPYYLWTTPLTGTTVLITATLYNVGPITATDVTVGFYRRETLDGAALLLTRSVASLGPGRAAQLTAQVDGPLGCGVYLLADPERAIAETTRINNLAAATAPGGRCANFSNAPASGLRPLAVQFADASTGANTGWQWDFGDGGTSAEQNPSHEYTAAGAYTVMLEVSGPDGSDAFSRPSAVVVYEPAVAAFSAAPADGLAPLEVTFTDESTGDIVAWAWDLGDGATSFEQNPVHTYTAPGTYSVTLTVSGPGGEDSLTQVDCIHVWEPVVAGFTATPQSGPKPLGVAFTNTSTGDYTALVWAFGDGATSTEQNPLHGYVNAGRYTAELAVSGPGGTDTEAQYITVYQGAAHVGMIYITAQPVGGEYGLQASIRVLNHLGQVVPGATVRMQWRLPDGTLLARQAPSNAQGWAVFKLRSPQTGVYRVCVGSITKSGWVYDPSQNVETCDTKTVP